ncbi:MAG: YceI family protein [Lysobacter sp.]
MSTTSHRAPYRKASAARWALALAGVLAASGTAVAADYVQAPGSTLTFASSFEGEVFTGHFSRFRTTLRFDPGQLDRAVLEVDIPLASANTANPERDETLQSSDFFSSKLFPQARYTAKTFRHLGQDRYAADGTLTVRNISRPVTLTFTWTAGASPVLTGRASVQRLEFGIGGGDWASPEMIPATVAISTRVNLAPAP